ncbi:MAG: RDD family protein, partial [Chloroflexi bacterium]|nr:RDD family protein [Chloroflexota bacterium]
MAQQPQRFIESCYHPEDLQTATQGRRLVGYVLDSLIVVLTFGIGWLVWLLLAAPRGQSPGKQLLGMYIIRNDGSRAGGAYTWVRELIIKVLLFGGLFAVLGAMTGGLGQLLWVIPALWCVWDAERQCLWDKVGSTYIAHSPQGYRPLT